jgi:hypothetical protein
MTTADPDTKVIATTLTAYEQAHSPERASSAEANVIACAWLGSFLMPPVGFALGVLLTARQREGHGIWTMVLSVLMPICWYIVISGLNSLPRY